MNEYVAMLQTNVNCLEKTYSTLGESRLRVYSSLKDQQLKLLANFSVTNVLTLIFTKQRISKLQIMVTLFTNMI